MQRTTAKSHIPSTSQRAGIYSVSVLSTEVAVFPILVGQSHFIRHLFEKAEPPKVALRHAMRNMLKTPYRGLPIHLGLFGPYKFTMLATYDHMLHSALPRLPHLQSDTLPGQMLAGGVAGLTASLITTPLEYGRMQQQLFPKTTVKSFVASISDAPHLGWRGGVLCASRDIIYASSVLGGSTWLQNQYASRTDLPESISRAGFGALCGLGSAVISQPLDTIKNIKQCKQPHQTTPSSKSVHQKISMNWFAELFILAGWQ